MKKNIIIHIFVVLMAFMLVTACSYLPMKSSKEGSSQMMPIKSSKYTEKAPMNEQTLTRGKEIYEGVCVECHGKLGKGDGPVSFFLNRDHGPHPRDFTSGVFKFRSTKSGNLPTDDDLFRTVTNGVVGFMPSFSGLEVNDRWAVIYHIKGYFEGFMDASPALVEIVGRPVPESADSIERGYSVYQEMQCFQCHGGGGEGNGTSAPTLKDDWGFLLPPANLTIPGSFKNGSRPEDIYRTITTGLDGSGMPSYEQAFKGREEDIWHLANYILSLSQQR